ncbi:sensor histidine kinase [Sporolactobacillus putidus]|uniref:Sensor histidine kinase n=1 Tax=Sporolactobacillus putidus TaxID=492735 RepID=A0A917S982_9BACL|nr:sensor histidine kinase [Sporolactobacillus putidus]GGL64824.1 sensor histidine kinase [Sporolactobacillus putidus]
MTAIKRQMITGAIFSLFLLVIFAVFFFLTFPIGDWALLWERQIWHLPFIFIIPIIALFGGSIAGFISGAYWRKVLLTIDDTLELLEQGNEPVPAHSSVEETESILKRVDRLSQQITLQTQLTQKMANEKADIEEKAIQKIVSEERNRLARELHDSVSQQLFAASMLLSTINETRTQTDDIETHRLRLVEQTIHQSQLEMRALFLHLRPVQLHGKSLKDGMQELLGELRQKVPMKISWTVEPINLDKGIEDQLFRILQESVSNTLRHAKALTLDVLLIKREKLVIMRVTDDGVGFDPDTAKPGSYGLQNMRERAAQIGGQMKLVSLPNKGTSLEIKVPILERDESND